MDLSHVLLTAHLQHYADATVISRVNVPLTFSGDQATVEEGGRVWHITRQTKAIAGWSHAYEVTVTATLKSGNASEVALTLDWVNQGWSKAHHVHLPAAIYAGNRFDSRAIPYSPKLTDPKDIGPHVPTIVTDVPRLNIGDGPSRIQQLAGDLAAPAMGAYDPERKQVMWLFTDAQLPAGSTGFSVTESDSRSECTFTIAVPGVREGTRYSLCSTQTPSEDKGASLNAGDQLSLRVGVYFTEGETLQSLFDAYVVIRGEIPFARETHYTIPMSSSWAIQEKKYNDQNWEDTCGYYSVGMRENFLQNWQIGWTGGLMSTLPLLFAGSEQSRQRVISTFNYVFPNGIAPSGFFWDSGEFGKWYGGDIRREHTKNWHLVRKSGDGLYFVVRQLMLMERLSITIEPAWKTGTQTVADAFVKLWKENGQLGQFIDSITGEIRVGGSASGAIVPAALAMAAQYFGKPHYLQVATEIADYLNDQFVQKGFATGGPGDAMQNPDSESAFALVISYTTLYEATGDAKWLAIAEAAAKQYATWVVAYDYKFPSESLFGRLNIRTTGAVNANTQNKHGSPGICTDSGLALWKLFRATGDVFYWDLLAETVRNLPQYLSRADRKIGDMDPGWINERVNMSDWNEPVGEIFHGTTWAEICLMLAYTELPGLYVQLDKGTAWALDQLQVEVREAVAGQSLCVRLTNPTKFPANVRVWIERDSDQQSFLGEHAMLAARTVFVGAGETVEHTFVASDVTRVAQEA